MARAAAERVIRASELARLVFEPTAGRMEFALRLGAICAATTLVGEMYRTPPDLALAVYIVFFFNAADRARSLVLTLVMTALLTFCLLVILGVVTLVMNDPMWKVVSIAVLSIALLFLGTASVIGEVAGTLALIVGYGLDVMSRLPVGDFAARGVLYAWVLAGLPAPLSILFNLMMAPSPRALVQRRLAAALRCAAKLLTDPDRATQRCARACLRRDVQETPKLLELAGLERVSPAKDLAALRQASLSTTGILTVADLADRDADARPPASVVAPFAGVLEAMAVVLADGGYPLEIDAPNADVASLHPRAAAVISELRVHVSSFASPPPAGAPSPAPKARRRFFRPDAFTNPEYVQHALRTTAAAMTCYFIYTLLRWDGIHTCFITCYIVSLGTVADSIEKLALRIAGCLVGAAAGIGAIVFVIPHMSSITELLALVFVGTFASAWVAGGSPHVAYAGFQMAFAFLLCVLQHYDAGSNMVTARDRIWGILIGNAVAYVFLTRLWPVSVSGRIRDRVVDALRNLRTVSAATRRQEGLVAEGLVQADLASIDDALALARLEPSPVRADTRWIERHERASHEIGALCEVLGFGTGTNAAAGAVVGERLGEIADAMGGGSRTRDDAVQVAARGPGPPAWEPFRSAVDAGLRRLEATLTLDLRGEDAPDAALAGT